MKTKKEKVMKIYRHGDVLIREIESIPDPAKLEKEGKKVTIALGEATGHHHTLYGNFPISLLTFDNRRYLEIREEVELKHQEHHCLKIDRGSYEIIIEREHDYFENAIKKVQD